MKLSDRTKKRLDSKFESFVKSPDYARLSKEKNGSARARRLITAKSRNRKGRLGFIGKVKALLEGGWITGFIYKK